MKTNSFYFIIQTGQIQIIDRKKHMFKLAQVCVNKKRQERINSESVIY